jgi:hypothetical protein
MWIETVKNKIDKNHIFSETLVINGIDMFFLYQKKDIKSLILKDIINDVQYDISDLSKLKAYYIAEKLLKISNTDIDIADKKINKNIYDFLEEKLLSITHSIYNNKNGNYLYKNYEDITLFQYNIKNKELICDYSKIWLVIENNFGLIDEDQLLMTVNEVFSLYFDLKVLRFNYI